MATLVVLSGATATNGKPSAATHGAKLWRNQLPDDSEGGAGRGLIRGTDRAILTLSAPVTASTAGSVTIKLWGYNASISQGDWVPLGTHTADADRGKINEATAIDEIDAADEKLLHSEIVSGLSAFERIYAEVVAIANIAAGGVKVTLIGTASAARRAVA